MLRKLNHQRNALLRKFKLWLADQIFNKLSRISKKNKYEANLVLRLDGKIGDAVTSTGFLRELKHQFSNEKLIVIVVGSQKEIFNNLNFIDQVIDLKQKGLFKTVLHLWNINFRFIFNTTHILKPKMLFLTSLLKASQKITFSNFQIKTFSKHIDIDFKKDHITDRYRKTLASLSLSAKNLSYEINANSSLAISLKNEGFKKIIALNSFAGAKDRNLSFEKTIEIVKRLVENPDVCVVSLASRSDSEKIQKWMKVFSHPRWKHFPEIDTLEKNCTILKQSDLLITPDTAWVHIASALKIKLLAIYREDTSPNEINSVIWAPYLTDYKMIFTSGHTMENLKISEVASQAQELLK